MYRDGARWGKSGGEWTGWGWRNEEGSWLHRKGDAYLKERLVICNDEDTGGRAMVTTDEKRVLHCKSVTPILKPSLTCSACRAGYLSCDQVTCTLATANSAPSPSLLMTLFFIVLRRTSRTAWGVSIALRTASRSLHSNSLVCHVHHNIQ